MEPAPEKMSYEDLKNSNYRVLQQMTKSMGLPSNVKKMYLIEMLFAKNHSSPEAFNAIVDRIKKERKLMSKSRKVNAKKKKRIQGSEISSTINSPPICTTPQPTHTIMRCNTSILNPLLTRNSHNFTRLSRNYGQISQTRVSRNSDQVSRNSDRVSLNSDRVSRNSDRVSLNSDRVLRSYHNMRRNVKYSIVSLNSTVVDVFKAQNADIRQEIKSYEVSKDTQKYLPINAVVQRGRGSNGPVEHTLLRSTVNTEAVLPSNSRRETFGFNEERRANIASRPPIRERRLSGIYPLNPFDQPFTHHKPTSIFNSRTQDGRIAKPNINQNKQIYTPINLTKNKTKLPMDSKPLVVLKNCNMTTMQDIVNLNIDRSFSNSSTETARDSGDERDSQTLKRSIGNRKCEKFTETRNYGGNSSKEYTTEYAKSKVNTTTTKTVIKTKREIQKLTVNNLKQMEAGKIQTEKQRQCQIKTVRAVKNRESQNQGRPVHRQNQAATSKLGGPNHRQYAMVSRVATDNQGRRDYRQATTDNQDRRYYRQATTDNQSRTDYKQVTTDNGSINFNGTRNPDSSVQNVYSDTLFDGNQNTAVNLQPLCGDIKKYPNMSFLNELSLSNVPELVQEISSQSNNRTSVHYHNCTRSDYNQRPLQLEEGVERLVPQEGSLPRISEVFSQVDNHRFKNLSQPLYVDVGDGADLVNVVDSGPLESYYNYKCKYLMQPFEQFVCLKKNTTTAFDTRLVYSTDIVTTAVPHDATPLNPDCRTISPSRVNQQCSVVEPTPERQDCMKLHGKYESQHVGHGEDLICDEGSQICSPGSSRRASLCSSVDTAELEDALDLISQDGDYMERIGMDVRTPCISCDWTGPRSILEYHVRLEHSSRITQRDTSVWSQSIALCDLRAGVLSISEFRNCIYVLAVVTTDTDTCQATLNVLPKDEDPTIDSPPLPNNGRLTIYNRVTGEPHTWEGPILPLFAEDSYQSLYLNLSELDLLPNSANLKLVNGDFVADSSAKVIAGQPELENIMVEVHVQILD